MKKSVDRLAGNLYNICCEFRAGVAELADAQASGACGSNIVWVQVPSPALRKRSCCHYAMAFLYAQEVILCYIEPIQEIRKNCLF